MLSKAVEEQYAWDSKIHSGACIYCFSGYSGGKN
jgi:hypothetical protein